jgi:hypothetical protein
MDPVTLGLCSQIDLDLEVSRASKGGVAGPEEAQQGTMLLTAEEAMASAGSRGHGSSPEDQDHQRTEHEEELHADSVFAKLKSLKRDDDDQ